MALVSAAALALGCAGRPCSCSCCACAGAGWEEGGGAADDAVRPMLLAKCT
uniref:Uncharacterized protein n=1 Tax=Oryza sativa subsp. japonica TaxID=39947 RepID=Q84MG0_ORYSJ|nr:hypothetical protein Os03g30900 [Oryza sativa Japonica Group]